MPGYGKVSAVLRSLNGASEIGKEIRDANFILERMEMKKHLTDLTAYLSVAKMELALLQESIEEKDAELLRQAEALAYRGNVKRRGDGYYRTVDNRPYGQPYCSYCWENDQKLIHLHNRVLSNDIRICPCCKNEYQNARTPYIEADLLAV
ncbi:hypothetical protein [Bacterioplanoides sp.]|uniref:hypothetical protein n=1 Tax=Bacterioplanoides sp. TaxID=2066072 RepID=UPI003B5B2966